MGNHTISAYPLKLLLEPTNATVTNRNNIFDTNDSTYGVIDVKSNKVSDFILAGFDFNSIPADATINSVKLETSAKVENSSYVKVIVITCRKYTNGTGAGQGTSYDEVWFNSTSLNTHTFSGTRIGTWKRDELAGWSTTSPDEPYSGIAFYIRVKNTYVLGARSATFYYFKTIVDYSIPDYTLTVNATTGGTVTGGGTYESGKTVTLTAIPNDGYKFVSWSDGDTNANASRTVTVTGNATYTAIFVPDSYITYDSIFSFKKWKAKGISGNSATVSAITDTGFILTSANDAGEGTATSPYFPVEPGKSYTIDIDIGGNNWDIYIFFCDADGNWIDFVDGPTNRFSYDTDWGNTFTAPNKDSVVKAQIRCDANGSNNAVSFGNFRIYPAEYDYMSNSVPANERTDTDSWSIPTPTREGYTFLGWFTEPIGGIQYNSNSAFPTTDLVLYSQWKLNKINQIYIGNQLISEIYIGTQPVKAVYIGTQKIYG